MIHKEDTETLKVATRIYNLNAPINNQLSKMGLSCPQYGKPVKNIKQTCKLREVGSGIGKDVNAMSGNAKNITLTSRRLNSYAEGKDVNEQ